MSASAAAMTRTSRLPAALDRLAPLAVGLGAVGAASTALLPGVWFWDTAEAQTVPPLLGVMHPTGFPAYTLLGWLVSALLTPFGEPAWRMNVLSALLLGVAAAGTVVTSRRLGAPTPLAAAAGLGLAVTPVAWRIGTHADVHALHVALVALILAALAGWQRAVARDEPRADRQLIVAAALVGVSLANHQLTLLLGLPILLFVLAVDATVFRRPRTLVGVAVAVAAIPVLLYLQLPLRAGVFPAPIVYGDPTTWEGLRYVILAEQFRGALANPLGDPLGIVLTIGARAWAEFGLVALVLPVAFAATALRNGPYALLTGLAVVLTLAFNAVYINANIERYDLGPVLMAWTWVAVLGAGVVRAVAERLYALDTDEDRRAATSGLALGLAAAMLLPAVADLPGRHAFVDRSSDRSGERWLDATFAALERDAVVVSWWSYSTPLWYGQLIEGRRLDVAVIDDRTRLDEGLGEVTDVIDAHLGRRPVYLMRARPEEVAVLGGRYRLELVPDTDVVYRVLPPEPAA